MFLTQWKCERGIEQFELEAGDRGSLQRRRGREFLLVKQVDSYKSFRSLYSHIRGGQSGKKLKQNCFETGLETESSFGSESTVTLTDPKLGRN